MNEIHLLFVDDEVAILDGLRNLLRKERKRWNMVFVEGAEAGLAAILCVGEVLEEQTDMPLPNVPDWTDKEKLAGEKELLGVYMSGHPLSQYADLLETYQLSTVRKLAELPEGTMTRLGGLIAQVDNKITKKKEAMAVLRLEDLDGSVEVVVFPDTYREFSQFLKPNTAILLCGSVSKKDEVSTIRAMEIYPLENAPRYFADRLSLHIPATSVEAGKLAGVREILAKYPGPVPVVICLEYPSGAKVFLNTEQALNVTPSRELIHQAEHLLGEKSVYVAVNPNPCRKARAHRRAHNGN